MKFLGKKRVLNIWTILLLGFSLRILMVLLSSHISNYDLQSYELIGEATRQGRNIYPSPANFHHPYFPLMLYMEASATLFGQYQTIFLKIIFSLFDTGIIYLLYLMKKSELDNAALFYAINPISILITSVQGQFDAIPLFFLLLGLYFFRQKKSLTLPYLFLSFAICVKTWPALFILPFLKRLKSLRQFLITTTLLISLPVFSLVIYGFFFHGNPLSILLTLKAYRPVFGVFGTGLIAKYFFHIQDMRSVNNLTYLFLFVFVSYSLFMKKKSVIKDLVFQLLVFLILMPVFGTQWLIWLVPFLLLLKPAETRVFFLIATAYLLVSYAVWFGLKTEALSLIGSIFVWLGLIVIFWQRNFFQLRNIKRTV